MALPRIKSCVRKPSEHPLPSDWRKRIILSTTRIGIMMRDGLEERDRQVQEARAKLDPLFQQIGRVIVGQRDLLDRLILGLLTGGHMLIEGVPGLAKTLAVRTLAKVLNLSFQRIQFTPDLLPADVI